MSLEQLARSRWYRDHLKGKAVDLRLLCSALVCRCHKSLQSLLFSNDRGLSLPFCSTDTLPRTPRGTFGFLTPTWHLLSWFSPWKATVRTQNEPFYFSGIWRALIWRYLPDLTSPRKNSEFSSAGDGRSGERVLLMQTRYAPFFRLSIAFPMLIECESFSEGDTEKQHGIFEYTIEFDDR